MIYTFGDGFASGHIWPDWPKFVEALAQQPVTNYGHIGAGNEFIFNCAVHAALVAKPGDTFLVQWAQTQRFDKLKQNSQWENLQQSDKVYSNISADVFGQSWWATSNSSIPEVKQYNHFYVESEQSINRTVLFLVTLASLLDSKNINYVYLSTYPLGIDRHSLYDVCKDLHWNSIDPISIYRRQFDDVKAEIQPKPIVHFVYALKILESIGININNVDKIKKLVESKTFIPYDPDREQHWKDLKNEISLLL